MKAGSLLTLTLVFLTINGRNEQERVKLRLMHVIPAKDALYAQESGNMALQQALLSQVILPSVATRGDQIAIQSGREYLFSLGSEYRIEDAPQFGSFMSRIPAVLPKPDDQETILSFAKMSANSYVARTLDEWRNATDYSDDDGFGWNSTGLRGHIFVNDLHTIVVISFKGTSTILHGGETVARDKYMDNLMFSCCCARVDISWTPICGCYQGNSDGKSQCDAACLRDTVKGDSDSYYNEALAVTQLAIAKYPRAQVWFTGHSLGGAIAALMAVSVKNTAAITFASPGPLLYARHLGLHDGEEEGAQWQYPIWNFGLASDPIYLGTCTGLVTSCYLSGYAIQTACRPGMDCEYAVSSWQPDVATHRIDWMIDHVLMKQDKYPLPQCIPNRNCTDCQQWTFV